MWNYRLISVYRNGEIYKGKVRGRISNTLHTFACQEMRTNKIFIHYSSKWSPGHPAKYYTKKLDLYWIFLSASDYSDEVD